MTKRILTVLSALAFAVALGTASVVATPAVAAGWHGGGGHSGGRGGYGHGGYGRGYGHGGYGYRGYGYGGYGYGLGLGFGLGYGLGYYGYGYPWYYGYDYGDGYGVYGYPNGSPYDYSAAPLSQPQTAPPQQSFWYFCRSSNAYYPYVSSCPEAWQRVPTTPPPQG